MSSEWGNSVVLCLEISLRIDGRWMPPETWARFVFSAPKLLRYLQQYPSLIESAKNRFPVRLIFDDGTVVWMLNGKRHRLSGGPASQVGSRALWYVNGTLHRDDGGPACITDEFKKWIHNGKLHRVDGPAIEAKMEVRGRGEGVDSQWFRNGRLHRSGGEPAHYNTFGTRFGFWVNGHPHRIGGPALIFPPDREEWYRAGILHREGDAPAVSDRAVLEWWKDGRRHRTTGPAVVWPGGYTERWIDGVRYASRDGPS